MPSSEGKEEAPQNKEEAKEERCTCGHFLSEKQATLQSSSPSSSAASINHCSPKTAAHLLDTSFVHLPALLYQPSDSTPIRKYVRASSNNFWEIHQHLEHLIRACQNHGGKEDEVPLLCSDCITRYVWL